MLILMVFQNSDELRECYYDLSHDNLGKYKLDLYMINTGIILFDCHQAFRNREAFLMNELVYVNNKLCL
jgi:hypothetical protein